jgi:16S rRNA (guanine527-N7)-methyltransferase
MINDILTQATSEIGLTLSEEHIKLFGVYVSELKKWNSRMNLTAITADKEIVIKHIIDSLQLAARVDDEDVLLDVGSGAGLPVIPLKIIKTQTTMLSVDAVEKKIAFQRHVIRSLGLQKIEALHARIEDLQKTYAGKFSIITSRAFTRLDHFIALATPLLARGGSLIAMKGEDVENEIADSNDIMKKLGCTVTDIHYYELPCGMGKHSLAVITAREQA